jgi:glycosyltransferase involved in cell wall biosynthesis
MRIAHGLLSHEFAGAERHLAELAAYQTGEGHQVHLLLETLKPAIEARWRNAVPKAKFHFLPAWWPSFASGLWALFVLYQLKTSHLKPRTSNLIYHAHLGRAARRLGWAARVLKIPFIATLHLDYRKKEHAKADGLIRICDWQKRDMASYTGQATTIWNWVAPAKNPPKDARQKLRTGLQANAKTIVFLSAGRLVPQKGMDILIRAFEKAFPKKSENVRLLIAGTGPMEHDLNTLIDTDKRIVPVGYVNDVTPLYAAADVFISAARFEPFGLVVLEAMSNGLPLICTRTDGPSEFLAGGAEGRRIGGAEGKVLWATPNDVDTLAAALKKAKAGRVKYDLTPFKVEKAGKAVLAFYKQVIGK